MANFSRRAFLSSATALPAALAQRARRPNIVWIMADDLGIGDLGCYGQKLIQTPNIDALAREGTRFTDCYAGAQVCAPSRSALMTGLHTGHTTVRSNHSVRTGQRVPLRAEDITVAQVLRQAGYHTALIGKWGLGEPETTGVPNRQGFDEFYGYLNQDHAADHYTDYLWRNETREPIPGNRNGARRIYTHDLFAEEALRFVNRPHSKPFFLYLAFTLPHAEITVPDDAPYSSKPWTPPQRTYAAMVSRLDRDVGRFFRALRNQGLERDTLVFFTSDNGGTFPPAIELFQSTGRFRGKKGTVYEGGIRTPMIARWPGRIPAGSVNSTPWAFWDFLPTAAEAAGATPLGGLDGVSVLPALFGRRQDLSQRPLYWEAPARRSFWQAMRLGDWKGVRNGLRGKLELYHLAEDPSESKDVAAQHPDVAQRICDLMAQSRTESLEYPSA